MNNEEILKLRWNKIDKELQKHLKEYQKINKRTQDKIQSVLNDIDYTFNDLNQYMTQKEKDKLKRVVEEWDEKGLLVGYFGYVVSEILNQSKITRHSALKLLIWACFIEERSILSEKERELFLKVSKEVYEQGVNDLKVNNPFSINWGIVALWLMIPNIKGDLWNDYVEAMALTNAEAIEKQTIINMQQNKTLNVDDEVYQRLLKKQQNYYLSINKDKYSGALDSQVVELVNMSYLKASENVKDKTLKARFIAEVDEKTTMMCKGMNGMLFNVNDWNEFYRYSAMDGKDVHYKVYGLEKGVNLPPINNHFHYCRSTITYQLDYTNEDYMRDKNRHKIEYKDYTFEFLKNRTEKGSIKTYKKGDKFTYEGKEYEVDKNAKIDTKNNEQEITNWLANKMGKDVEELPKVEENNVKTPDYIIDGEKWDLKTIKGSSEQALFHAVEDKEKQSHNFIFDITDSQLSASDFKLQLNRVLKRDDTWFVNKVIIKKDDEFYILKAK